MAPDGLPGRFSSLVQDSAFLGVIHGFERQLAKVMATVLGVVLVIVMSLHSEHNPFFLIGIGVAVPAFAAAYWLARDSHASRPPSDTVTRQGAG